MRSEAAGTEMQLDQERVSAVQQAILSWYAREQRDLPWRHTHDPYAILVSEIMLQQTQVDRVLPKYHQFLTAFPTLQALATAPLAEVLSVWVPLGYNRRAVQLQGIAQQVLRDYNGQIPATIAELLTLKGIGRYTAGAIACFAHRQQVATVDTNIRRVLHRLFLGVDLPAPRINDVAMLKLAEQVLPPGEAYNWNQSLMDLGATICTSQSPSCGICPFQEHCAAYAELAQQSLFPDGSVFRQLRAVAEKKAPYQSQPFKTSNRYFRGRVIALLRHLAPGERLSLAALGPQLKSDYSETDLPWLEKVVAGLAKDGLIDQRATGICLPDAPGSQQ